jgi:hypothetical protein
METQIEELWAAPNPPGPPWASDDSDTDGVQPWVSGRTDPIKSIEGSVMVVGGDELRVCPPDTLAPAGSQSLGRKWTTAFPLPSHLPANVVDSERAATAKSMKIKGFIIDSDVVNFVGNGVK